MNPKNLIEAKRVVKGLLKNELCETHLKSSNIAPDTAILHSDKIFCLVKYLDTALENLDEILPETASTIKWKRYVQLEKSIFERYVDQLDTIKRERPVKGTVVFVLHTGEIYMISPYACMDFLEEYPLIFKRNSTEFLCFPTIFLQVPDGSRRSEEELDAQQRIALIAQINSLKPAEIDGYDIDDEDLDEYERDLYACFFPEKNRSSFSSDFRSKYSELADDDIRNLMIHLLYEMSKNLGEIRREMKSIKKLLRGK